MQGEVSISGIVFLIGVTLMALALIVELFNKGVRK